MITKRQLLGMICDLATELDDLRDDVRTLEKEVHKPKPIKRGTNTDGVKRKPGRPKKQK